MQAPTARDDWSVWTCDASVVVTAPTDIAAASSIVRNILREVDDACSRFRPDSELARRANAFASGAEASPMLASLVGAALEAARLTDGDVDPTLGSELAGLGYDRDLSTLYVGAELASAPIAMSISQRHSPWRQIALEGNMLTIPRGVQLDLGASAKAAAADLAATTVAAQLGGGVLVSIGGDIATAGSTPAEGWEILVQDTDADPRQQVSLAAGAAMATSSTQKRRWMSGGYLRHHILDPQSGLPATPTWRSVTVAASSCLQANALSTASIVRGFRAVQWLENINIGARFVDLQGRVVATSQWPTPVETLELTGGTR
jgi:thiamine biosynthesis lipoprotein